MPSQPILPPEKCPKKPGENKVRQCLSRSEVTRKIVSEVLNQPYWRVEVGRLPNMTPVNSSINTVEAIFWLLAICYIIVGLTINVLEQFLPGFMRRLLFYGKISGNGSSKGDLMTLLLVPKSWFRHFYLFATIWGSIVLVVTVRAFSTGQIFTLFSDFLQYACGNHRTVQSKLKLIIICAQLQ